MHILLHVRTCIYNVYVGPNPGGIGVYNAEVENYLLQFLLVEKSDKPTTALIHQISMPPETMEFDRVGSLRRGQLNSADSSDSIDSGVGGDTTSSVDGGTHQPQIRGRAATFDVYKIRTRVGSKVSTVTKFTQEVLASKPTQHQKSKSPSMRRLLSTKRRITSSPQMFRIPPRRTSSAERALESSASVPTSPIALGVLENGDVVKSKAKENGVVCAIGGGEEGEGGEESEGVDSAIKNRTPRSADSSPQESPVFQHTSRIREHSVKRAK